MAILSPQPGMQIAIAGKLYEFVPYRFFADDEMSVRMVEGQEALIYVLRAVATKALWALKVFKPAYRSEHILHSSVALSAYKEVPGFYVGHRICLTMPAHSALLQQFPELEYAVLMPWLVWKSWAAMIRFPTLSEQYTSGQALELATTTARVLSVLEKDKLAHTDLSGANIAFAPDFTRVELLDIEGLYIPNRSMPKHESLGSPGYQHKRLGRHGQSCEEGDRFAGAILLVEMLTWWYSKLRSELPSSAMSLFYTTELQKAAGARWKIVRDVLWSLNPTLLHLFDQAWNSSDPARCPKLSEWATCLESTLL